MIPKEHKVWKRIFGWHRGDAVIFQSRNGKWVSGTIFGFTGREEDVIVMSKEKGRKMRIYFVNQKNLEIPT